MPGDLSFSSVVRRHQNLDELGVPQSVATSAADWTCAPSCAPEGSCVATLPRCCTHIMRFPITTPCWHRVAYRCVASSTHATAWGQRVPSPSLIQHPIPAVTLDSNGFDGKSMGFTDVVATVCETALHEFAQRPDVPATKLVAIPNGIRVDKFFPASAEIRQQLRAALGLPQGTRLAGFCRIAWIWAKDHATLIRAFRLVQERLPGSVLLLIGDGPLKPMLMEPRSRRR